MELDHEFTVATDADTAWPVLLDVERMHPLIPGAVYESGTDGEYRGRLKVKFGPTTITYRGSVRIAVLDDLTRTAILEVTAREARGQGTVTGSFQATVLPSGDSCRVVLHTTLVFADGRAGSLGEHLVHDTGAKLLARFSAGLNALLASPAKTASAEQTAPEPAIAETEPATAEPAVTIEAVAEEPAPTAPLPPLLPEQDTAETTPVEQDTAEPEAAEAEPATAEPATAEPALAEPVATEAVAGEPAPTGSSGAEVGIAAAPGPAGDGGPELELYELAERPGWLRRVLPIAGALVLLLVVRRFVRRR
ncbi:SRPBCC domain-containing protein [Actinocorallia sp. B10E7]|uniref:SRPBCC family protein n=1 Tax=Actinocorallia sp. B10E7 TaxID=3153558 RepID=UPI00325E262B